MANIDSGHAALMEDLDSLFDEAQRHQFHDFMNEKYAAPKMALAEKLQAIRQNVIDGKYDN